MEEIIGRAAKTPHGRVRQPHGRVRQAAAQTYQIRLEKALGQKFTVKFVCTETDKNIFGTKYADSRMNAREGATTYEFNSSGGWGVAGSGVTLPASAQTISVGSGNCSVKLDYNITIL